MTPDELAGIQEAFTKSLEPMVSELRGIHRVLDEHSQILHEHSKLLRVLHEHSHLLRNIDGRLVRVEGLLDGLAGAQPHRFLTGSPRPPFFHAPAAERRAPLGN